MRFAPWFVAALASNVFALAACGDDGGSSNLTGFTVGDVDVSTAEDTPISVAIPVHAGSTSQLTVTIATQPQHGTVTATEGDVTTYSYTPAANYDGPDTFTATVTDGTNTATGTVNITVTPVDDAPAVGSAMFTTPLNTALTIQTSALLADATDVENDTLTLTSVQDVLNGTVVLSGGTVTFTPANQFFGATTFTFTVSDGHLSTTGTVTVNVGGDNHAPVAVDDSATTPENTPLVVGAATLTGNDTDADGNSLHITAVENAQHGTVALDTSSNTVTFTPDNHFHGSAKFDYTIDDGNGGTDIGTVVVTVTHVNQNPVANPDSLTVAQGTIGTVNVLANDSDADGDGLTLASVTQGANGAVTFAGGVASYAPNPGFTGADSFTYTISDGNGGTATGTVSVTVVGVNHSPIANGDAMTVSENTAGSTNVLANDSDPDGDAIVISAITNAANGVTSFAGGVATYTPNANFVGADSFTYTISDNRGGTATATVTVNVVPVDRAPVATNDLLAAAENTAASTNILANDSDPDGDALTITNSTQPAHGAVTIGATGVATYTPAHNFSGNDSFTYTISDGRGGAATGVVSIQVTHVNQAPVAQNDTLATNENSQGSIDVASNDSDADGDQLTISAFTQPSHGSVAFSNTVAVYTPLQNFSGTDSFTYTISDGHGASATAFVTVTVQPGTPTLSEPTANNDAFSGNEDTQITGNVLANDTGTALSAILVSGPSHSNGEFGLNENGTFFYQGAQNFNGTDSFTYAASDGHVSTLPATVTITVLPVNDAPFAFDETFPENEGSHASFVLPLAAFDPDGDPVTFQLVGQPQHGTVVITDASGTPSATGDHVKYTPSDGEAGFQGPDAITYTATDSHGAVSDTATITLSLPACGDGVRNQSVGPGPQKQLEQCDDGNTVGGDGCEADCTFTCGVFNNDGNVGLPDAVTVDQDTGRCYAFYGQFDEGYAASQNQCLTFGGHLATLTNNNQNTIAQQAANGAESWIGANDIAGNGEHWLTGETFAFNNFDQQPPNNEGGGCAALDGDSFGWQTRDCTANLSGLLCQYDLYPNQDQFATSGAVSSVVTGDFNGDGLPDVAYLNVSTKTAGVALGDGLGGFRAQTVATLSTVPTALAAGDFDGDGTSDLAITSHDAGTVSVFINNGDGTFSAGTVLSTDVNSQNGPTAIQIVDVDLDNALDIVVANSLGGSVGVFYGINGEGGSFEAMRAYGIADGNVNVNGGGGEGGGGGGAAPVALAVGIIDTFGDPGIAVAAVANEPSSATITVLSVVANSEDARDLQQSFSEDVTSTPASIAIGDFDDDSNPDIAFGFFDSTLIENVFGTPAQQFEGEGGFVNVPGFASQEDFSDNAGTPVTVLAVNRVEGEDLYVFGSGPANAVTSFDGAEGFRAGIASHADSLAVADFDGDGTLDVVAAGSDSPVFTELAGHPFSNFGPAQSQETVIEATTTSNPLGLVAADFRHQGGSAASDLAVANSSDGTVSIMLQQQGFFPQRIFVGAAPYGVAAGDLNSDGFADIVVTNSADGTITVLLNNGNGFFTAQDPVQVGNDPTGVVVADFDGDGLDDVAVALRGDNQVVILHGDGGEGAPLAAPVPVVSVTTPVAIAAANFRNLQGGGVAADLAVAAENGNVLVLVNAEDTDLDFQSEQDLQGVGRPEAIAVGDLDGNGFADLAVTDSDANAVVVFETFDSNGDFFSTPSQTVAVGQTPTSVLLQDLDGDGFNDLAVANNGSSNVTLLLNSGFKPTSFGPGDFSRKQTLQLGSGPFSIVSGKFDPSGRLDIAVTDQRTDSVEILHTTRGQPVISAP